MKKMAFTGFVIVLMFTVAVFAAQKRYSYDDDIKTIVSSNCTLCHSWQGTYSKFLAQVSQETITSGNLIVVPEKPDESVFVWRIEGKMANGDPITQMPKGGDPLSDETIQMIRDWIEQGAIECCPTVAVQSHTWTQVKNKYK